MPRGANSFLGRFSTDVHLHVFELHDAQWDEFNIHAVIVETQERILVTVAQGLNVDDQSILENRISADQVVNQFAMFKPSDQNAFEDALRVVWILKMSHSLREGL